jgi:hypothetical protein
MMEGVGFAVIENQNDRLHTSSNLYFQVFLSAIALISQGEAIDWANYAT